MGKIATKYLTTHPRKIIEEGLHKDRIQVSESLFCISNEFCGVRNSFEEGSSFKNTLIGSYFNGIYDYSKQEHPTGYNGIVKFGHFMINAVNYFKVKIIVDGERVDLNKNTIEGFYRELDLDSGLVTRKFTLLTRMNKKISFSFERLLSMEEVQLAFQRITISSSDDAEVSISFMVDNKVIQWGHDLHWVEQRKIHIDNVIGLAANTMKSNQSTLSLSKVVNDQDFEPTYSEGKMFNSLDYNFRLVSGTPITFTRFVGNVINRESTDLRGMEEEALSLVNSSSHRGFSVFLAANIEYFKRVYQRSDIVIEGNDEDQQGIRYCIFMLESTYHGYSPHDNIGAKGLTGEAYSGHAFWDSETYCLPYYLFTNMEAARSLLLFRYNTLPEAKDRARQLDCRGACYPIATLNGTEGAQLWQHASTQFQPTTSVVYALYHYFQLSHDVQFIRDYGLEICFEATRFLLDRGQWDQTGKYFGFFGVMGPDEFKLMVNHNVYTNYMAKFVFDFTLEMVQKVGNASLLNKILSKCRLDKSIIGEMKLASKKMKILYNPKTHLYEQNEGFYKLPHIDIHSIPQEDFPLYHSWTYDRIYRYDMIKQPDVLMFIFLFMSKFSVADKKANYDYYEPRCIHESSLSPSIHSIFATELGYHNAAQDFFSFASRLDLDDYNRNTREGLHMTSIAAAWMNIVYGFGGMRSDGDILELNPVLPAKWKSYSFSIVYKDAQLKVKVKDSLLTITNTNRIPVDIKVCGKIVTIKDRYEIN